MASFEEKFDQNPTLYPDIRKYNSLIKINNRCKKLIEMIERNSNKKKINPNQQKWKREYNYLTIKKMLYYPVGGDIPMDFVFWKFELSTLDFLDREHEKTERSDITKFKRSLKIIHDLIAIFSKVSPDECRKKLYCTLY